MSSFVIAAPDALASAAAADEVSVAIAALFSGHGQRRRHFTPGLCRR
jgi:hypothetical protein